MKKQISTYIIAAFVLLGSSNCTTSTPRVPLYSTIERCRISRVVLIDEYQEGKSIYPTRLKWYLYTNEGYRVIAYYGGYHPGDSIDIEVLRKDTVRCLPIIDTLK